MSLTSKLLSASGGVDKLFSDDVFQAYTRTGTGADVTVTTGIDMTKGYLLWSKGRSGATDHALYDSVRGLTLDLASNSTAGQTTQTTGLKAVSTTGHTVGSLAKMNTNGATYVDWTFRKAPKFFDVVTYTGDGVNGRQIAHSLGIKPGFAIVKRTDTTGDWCVAHRSISGIGLLNSTAAFSSALTSGSPAFSGYVYIYGSFSTDTTFYVANGNDGNYNVNASGGTYVAYLFAHDESPESIVQCGSFTTDGSGNATVNLGWEPQFLIIKTSGVNTDNWRIYDTSRGYNHAANTGSLGLKADTSAAETPDSGQAERFYPFSTGFQTGSATFASTPYIYIAIRRSNKPPTLGTQVYNAIARTGTGAAATVTGVGFAPDLAIIRNRAQQDTITVDRLRSGSQILATNGTAAEQVSATYIQADAFSTSMDGIRVQTATAVNASAQTYINYFFKRAVGIFDEVAFTGPTSGSTTQLHNLTVIPELIIVKGRSIGNFWYSYTSTTGINKWLELNETSAATTLSNFWVTEPTTTAFTCSVDRMGTSGAARTHVAYLFASKAGISKVFSYTGNGSSQTIDCGFTTGARFVMIKRTDSTGDWYVWDSVRGIVASNDPHLSLNTTAAEVTTDDSVDPNVLGFDISQNTATNINVTSGTYIGLAFA